MKKQTKDQRKGIVKILIKIIKLQSPSEIYHVCLLEAISEDLMQRCPNV